MSLIKLNKNRFPLNNGPSDFLDRDPLFNDDFLNLEKSFPAINVKENDTGFEIELASPGFYKKDFEITLKNNVLEVSAQKSEEGEDKEDDYTRKEFNYRSFRKSLQLPKKVDDTKDVKATYKNGILKLQLFKKMEAHQEAKRTIEVV